MDSGDLPRFKVRALPPIGRRELGGTLPQFVRALAIMVTLFGVASIAFPHRPGAGPAAQASLAAPRV